MFDCVKVILYQYENITNSFFVQLWVFIAKQTIN